MSLIAQADLETRVGAGEVTRWSRGVAGNITAAIAQAESKARSSALNVFTAASWNAMTSSTLPGEAKYHLVSDAVDILSAGSGRPAEVQIKADEAKLWRSWLAGDTVRCFDGILTKLTAATGGSTVRVGVPAQTNGVQPAGSPTNVFDREDTNSELRRRVVKI